MNIHAASANQIVQTLRSAEHAIEIGQWELANRLLKRGLSELGDSYVRPDVTIDDSGMKLIIADMEENKGNLERASAIRRRVLSERLRQLLEKIAENGGAGTDR